MSILKNKNINFELVIVGSGPLEESLKNLVKDFGLEKQIIFTGQKTATELADYYKKSEIYIQASGYEGLPHVLLEAINYNLTLVSTPIGGSNEVLENGKNGWILQLVDGLKPDPNNLSSIIMDIKNSNESRKRKKSNAKNLLIEKFDEEQNLIKYLEVFQS
jgi:glycosyltransferase involved in cell wall biosynthesis